MRTAPPEQLVTFGMALQAGCIFFSDGVLRIRCEADGDRFFPATRFDVNLAWTVTRFATVGFIGCVRMLHRFAHRCALEDASLILMASCADIAAHVVTIGLGRSFGLRCRRDSFLLSRGYGR